jgi:hypothetical protein
MKRCLALLALLLVACSGNQIVTAVDAVVTTSEAVINVLPDIPATVKTEVTGYLQLATAGVTCVNTELNTSDTGVTRALKIAACFSSLNFSQLSITAQGYVSAVNAAIQALIALFPTSGANTAKLTAANHTAMAALEVRNLAVGRKVR